MHLQVIFGKRDHSLVRWTMSIFGPRSATWNAIPYVHIWWSTPKITDGPVRRLIVVCGQDSLLDSEWISANRIQNWSEWLAAGNASKVDRRLRDRTFTAAPVETKPLLRKQNECSAAAWQLKNRVQNLNRSPIQRRRRFGQATTSSRDLLNSVSVPLILNSWIVL